MTDCECEEYLEENDHGYILDRGDRPEKIGSRNAEGPAPEGCGAA